MVSKGDGFVGAAYMRPSPIGMRVAYMRPLRNPPTPLVKGAHATLPTRGFSALPNRIA